jgi:hypothetical protein
MIDLANDRGGEDNVSVIIIALDGVDMDGDTGELKNILMLDESTLVVKDGRKDPNEDSTLKLNNSSFINYHANAAPDSEGRDKLAPDQ